MSSLRGERNVWPPNQIVCLTTDSVLHLVDLTLHVIYLLFFMVYVLNPARSSGGRLTNESRSVCLVLYSASRIVKEGRNAPIPFYLTFFALLPFFPLAPKAYDFLYFHILLIAFGLHIIQLLVPHPPSAVLFVPSTAELPLSVMLQYLFESILIPVIAFFLPLFILSLYLIASSISIPFTLSTFSPAPDATRDAILTLAFVILILFFGLLASMTLQAPSFHAKSVYVPRNTKSWDTYGPTIGLSVRQTFFASIFYYSQPFFFPAPLNLIHFILVSVPFHSFRMIGRERQALRLKHLLETTLWCMLVIPLAVPFGVVWLWGLL